MLTLLAALLAGAAARAEDAKASAAAPPVEIASAAATAPAAAPPGAPASAAAEPAKPAPKWYDELTLNALVSTGYVQNLNDSKVNELRIFDRDGNTFSVGVAELVVQKPVAAAGDVGFRADLDFGGVIPTNSVYVSPSGKSDPIGLRQAFVSWIAPVGSGLRLDLGKMITLHGFEYIETFDNPNDNYSRSLLFAYAIPFTHTGLMLSYTFSPLVKAVVQVVNGWDSAISQQDGKTVCAQVNLTPSEAVSIYANYCGGSETVAGGAGTRIAARHLVDLNGTFKITPVITLGFNGDYGLETGSAAGGADAAWFGAALYLKAESASGWGLALRGEYFKDRDGVRTLVGKAPNTEVADTEVTVTPYVKINTRLTVRLEGRVDIADSEIFHRGDGTLTKTQPTIALNALFAY